jgi:hypothetical protein
MLRSHDTPPSHPARVLPFAQVVILIAAICALESGFLVFERYNTGAPDENTLLNYLAPGVPPGRHAARTTVTRAEVCYCAGALAVLGLMVGSWSTTPRSLLMWVTMASAIIVRDDFVETTSYRGGLRRSIFTAKSHGRNPEIEFRRVATSIAIVAASAAGAYGAIGVWRRRRRHRAGPASPAGPDGAARPRATVDPPPVGGPAPAYVLDYAPAPLRRRADTDLRLLVLVASSQVLGILFVVIRDWYQMIDFENLYRFPLTVVRDFADGWTLPLTAGMGAVAAVLIALHGVLVAWLFDSARAMTGAMLVCLAVAFRENLRFAQHFGDGRTGDAFGMPATGLAMAICGLGLLTAVGAKALYRRFATAHTGPPRLP